MMVATAAGHEPHHDDTEAHHQGATLMMTWPCLGERRMRYLISKFSSSTKPFLG
jgi:hypothetical protein